MDHKIYLCLLDCSSIQQYVFGSNKLKSNIGASHIVEIIYREWLPEALAKTFKGGSEKYCVDKWDDEKFYTQIQLKENENLLMETGYIGGGNALLLFRAWAEHNDENNFARTFVNLWTRRLLLYAPGARPVAAIVEGNLDDLNAGIKRVFEKLKWSKNSHVVETTIPRHGITSECKMTGLSAETLSPAQNGQWISAEACSKIIYAKKANKEIEQDEEYKQILQGKYEFPDEIENLGQSKGTENHIAIVHIDGNQIGQRFQNCQALAEFRRLSIQISHATEAAYRQTLGKLVAQMPELNRRVLSWDKTKNPQSKLLPLRRLIGAGDDVTFVCDARLGLFLAESFMRAFAKQKIKLYDDIPEVERERINNMQAPLSSCAGIAIIKTKYPFYRGYQLAEQLCSSAKKKGRKDNTSWLDFHISYRGLSGSLSDIRQQKYMVGKASLLWRPWKIVATSLKPFADLDDFAQLQEAILYFRRPVKRRGWPRSKIGELAQTLVKGPEETEEFIQFNQARGLILPPLAVSHIQKTGWFIYEENETPKIKTPYFDILEVMKFYPDCLLPEEKKDAL